MSAEVQRPTSNDDQEAWKAYWKAQGMPWRTKPEIDGERQQYLTERKGIQPDVDQGTYPFKDIKLDRADVEWLLATHESGGMRGPVDWSDPKQQDREGLDLRGVDLREADLNRLPLAGLRAGLRLSELHFMSAAEPDLEILPAFEVTEGLRAAAAHLEKARLDGAHLEDACLTFARLERTDCVETYLEGALLVWAHLEGATLYRAHLEGVVALAARFEGAEITDAHFEHANLLYADFSGTILVGTHLEDADLGRATFSDTTVLNGSWLGSRDHGLMGLHDVRWGGADVALVRWVKERPRRRHGGGTETGRWQGASAREAASLLAGSKAGDTASSRLLADRRALRASRQVALLLRNQGLHEEADRFAYRAQLLQRKVLLRQGHWGRTLGSWLLDLISGYGYKPMRSVITYLIVILSFAAAYFALTNCAITSFRPTHSSPLAWYEAIVLS